MVAAVGAWPGGEMAGVHRTYLDGPRKADLERPRLALGPIRGASVWLARPAPTMCVAEGIETGLSVQQASGYPTWAALSTAGLRTLRLPDLPLASNIVIAVDGDEDGRGAAIAAARKWESEGRTVRGAWFRDGEDANDVLRFEGPDAVREFVDGTRVGRPRIRT